MSIQEHVGGVEFFEQVLDALGAPVTVTDPDGAIVWFNRAAAQIHGWTRSDTAGKSILEVMPALSVRDPVEAVESTLAQGLSWSGEFILNRADGSSFPALMTASPVLDRAGDATHVVASAMDTSQLRALERRFRSGFESAPHGWAFTDLDGIVTDCNPHYCEIVGRPREQIVGHCPTEFNHDQDNSRATPFADMRQGRLPDLYTTRKRYQREDGTLRWVDVYVQLVRDLDGAPEFFFGHVQDVTEWLHAQHDAQAAESAYRELFNGVVFSIGTALGVRDPYTAGHQHRVAELSVAIGTHMGLDAERLEGLRVGGSLHDIGKVATPAEILTKPGRLDAAETAIMRRHPRAGHDIVAGIDFPWPVATMIIQHHERLDGSGFPHGLHAHDIVIESRILAVADTVESITSHRPYRPSRPVETALEVIADNTGALDPDVVAACIALFESGHTIHGDPR